MPRPFAATLVAALLAACGSSVAPSATPIGIPAPSATVAPNPVPTQPPDTPAPTATPLPTVTSAPTATPLPVVTPATPPASSQPAESEDRSLFDDGSAADAAAWRLLNASGASLFVDADRLAASYSRKLGWTFVVREIPLRSYVRVEAAFDSADRGYFGWTCADSTSGEHYGAVLQTDGSIVFIEGDAAGVDAIGRYEDVAVSALDRQDLRLGLDCFALADGTTVYIPFDAEGDPLSVYSEPPDDEHGANLFNAVGVYTEALSTDFRLEQSSSRGYGMVGPAGSMSFAAGKLMAVLPSDLGTRCAEAPALPASAPTRTVGVTCLAPPSAHGAELVQVFRFEDEAAMNASFGARFAPDDSHPRACFISVAPASWEHGLADCTVAAVGMRLSWTDERSMILASLIDLDGEPQHLIHGWKTLTGQR